MSVGAACSSAPGAACRAAGPRSPGSVRPTRPARLPLARRGFKGGVQDAGRAAVSLSAADGKKAPAPKRRWVENIPLFGLWHQLSGGTVAGSTVDDPRLWDFVEAVENIDGRDYPEFVDACYELRASFPAVPVRYMLFACWASAALVGRVADAEPFLLSCLRRLVSSKDLETEVEQVAGASKAALAKNRSAAKNEATENYVPKLGRPAAPEEERTRVAASACKVLMPTASGKDLDYIADVIRMAFPQADPATVGKQCEALGAGESQNGV